MSVPQKYLLVGCITGLKPPKVLYKCKHFFLVVQKLIWHLAQISQEAGVNVDSLCVFAAVSTAELCSLQFSLDTVKQPISRTDHALTYCSKNHISSHVTRLQTQSHDTSFDSSQPNQPPPIAANYSCSWCFFRSLFNMYPSFWVWKRLICQNKQQTFVSLPLPR